MKQEHAYLRKIMKHLFWLSLDRTRFPYLIIFIKIRVTRNVRGNKVGKIKLTLYIDMLQY